MSRRFLESIITRIDEWPVSVKIIAKHLQHTVGERFSDARLKRILWRGEESRGEEGRGGERRGEEGRGGEERRGEEGEQEQGGGGGEGHMVL